MQQRQLGHFWPEKKKKTHQSNPPVCLPYKSNRRNQMSPKREKNLVPCWILNVPETVSNQRQGCSEGADEKYLRLIILARKLMAGRKEEERQRKGKGKRRRRRGINMVFKSSRTELLGQAEKSFWGHHSGSSHSFYHVLIAFWMNPGFSDQTRRSPTSQENKQMLVPAKQFFTPWPPNPKVMER